MAVTRLKDQRRNSGQRALARLECTEEAWQVIDKLLQVAPETTIRLVRCVFAPVDHRVEEVCLQGLRMSGFPK
jgi:hypothetical protein